MIDKDVFAAIAIAGHPNIKSQQLRLMRNRAIAKLILEHQHPECHNLKLVQMSDHQEDKPKMTVTKAKVILKRYLSKRNIPH